MQDEKDNPNLIAPPPVIFLSGLLIGGFIAWHYHIPILPDFLARVSGYFFDSSGFGNRSNGDYPDAACENKCRAVEIA